MKSQSAGEALPAGSAGTDTSADGNQPETNPGSNASRNNVYEMYENLTLA